MVAIKDARLPDDIDGVRRLWLGYLTWGNDEMESRHGFRLPVEETVQQDVERRLGSSSLVTIVCCLRSTTTLRSLARAAVDV